MAVCTHSTEEQQSLVQAHEVYVLLRSKRHYEVTGTKVAKCLFCRMGLSDIRDRVKGNQYFLPSRFIR